MSYRRLDGIAEAGAEHKTLSLLPRGRAWRWLWLGVAESDSPTEARRVMQTNLGALLLIATVGGYLAAFMAIFGTTALTQMIAQATTVALGPLVWWLNVQRRLRAARWTLFTLATSFLLFAIVSGQGTVLSTHVYFLLVAMVVPTVFGARAMRSTLVLSGVNLALFGYFAWVGIAPDAVMGSISPAVRLMLERSVLTLSTLTLLAMILLVEAASADIESRLNHLANTDALTELHNRRFFIDQFAREARCAAHAGAPLSMAIIDIDHFKAVNDTLGHDAGDDALRHVARTLHGNMRPGDCMVRLGGEEFCWLLPDTSTRRAQQGAERVRAVLAQSPWVHKGQTHRLTVSIGVAAVAAGADHAAVLAQADLALYEAKGAGRNCVRVAADAAATLAPPCAIPNPSPSTLEPAHADA